MQHRIGSACLAGAFIFAGTSVVAAKVVGQALGPFTTTAISLLLALPLLLMAGRKKLAAHIRGMGRRQWLLAAAQAAFGIFLFRVFLLNGLARTSAAEAGILTGATPAATALMAALILRERVSIPRVAGIACTVAGILVLQGLLLPGALPDASHLMGNLLVLLAALSESVFNILSRVGALRHAANKGSSQDPIVQTALVAAIALLLCLVPSLAENPAPALTVLHPSDWAALAWYGLVSTALAYICWYGGINRCEATVAAAFSGLMPLAALALSVLLLGEKPSIQQWAGGVLVLAGMALSGMKEAVIRKEKPIAENNP